METKNFYEIIDQAVSLEVDMNSKVVTALTSLRIKVINPTINKRHIQLNAK